MYGNDDRTSSLNIDPAASTLSSALSVPVAARTRVECTAYGLNPYSDRRRSAILHRNSTLASRRRYPTHRRRVVFESTRRRGAQRFPGYLHDLGCRLAGRVEGCTGVVHGGGVVEERTTAHDECIWTSLGEVARHLYVFDQYAEQDDVPRFIAEWPVGWSRDG